MQSWITNTALFFLANFRIWGLGHQGNLQICNLWINHYIVVELQLRNTPKNLQICNWRTNKTNDAKGYYSAYKSETNIHKLVPISM